MVTKDYIVRADGRVYGFPKLLRESSDEFTKSNIKKYFDESYQTLLSQLNNFKNLPRALTLIEEKELQFMLQALLSAHFIMHEMQEQPSDEDHSMRENVK